MTQGKTTSLSKQELLNILAQGEIATELLTLAEITGDTSVAEQWSRFITGPAPWEHKFPPEIAAEIRERLAGALLRANLDSLPSVQLTERLLDHACGAPQGEGSSRLVLKEMGLVKDDVKWTRGRPAMAADTSVLVIGAGLSGIAIARKLKQLGIPFEVLEKRDASGGTWHQNTYPGCGVDIASHYFSYSFARNPRWSRYYAKQPEILAYLRSCVEQEDLARHITFNTSVISAEWDASNEYWVVKTRFGDGSVRTLTPRFVISAAGLLDRPSIAKFPGLDTFQGPAFHAAAWDHSVDLTGKRVVLVGTGASANQIGPTVAPIAEHLTVIQRTAHWNVGVANYMEIVSDGEKWLLEHVPAYERWFRARTLLSQNDTLRSAALVDPNWSSDDDSISETNAEVRKQLTQYIIDELGDRQDLLPSVLPDYPPFSKRMLRDNGWYQMLKLPNVDLVCSKTISFDGNTVVDERGERIPADAVVFATGFEASKMLASFSLKGRDGISIREVWGEDDPRAYLGMAVPKFPNFFIMYGPNTNIGTGGSIILQAETWSRYIADVIRSTVEKNISVVEVKTEACDDYNQRMDDRLAGMVWAVSAAGTWYRNTKGRITANMPWSSYEYWSMTQSVNFDDFEMTQAGLHEEEDLRPAVSA